MKKVKEFFNVICSNKQSLIGLILLLFFIGMAIAGMFVEIDMTVNYEGRYQPPSFEHLLGTDYGGRDTFLQLVKGSTDVLSIGLYTAIFSLIIGFAIGATAGFLGGWVDTALMFFTDMFLMIPSFPLMMIFAVTFRIKSNLAFAGILSIFMWAGLARAVRAQILAFKQSDFIVVCKSMGLSTPYIIFKEILPNITSYLAMNFIATIQGGIVASVGLMLLGLSPYSPTNWGMMLNLAIKNTGGIFNPKGYYYLMSPMACLVLFQLGCIFFSHGLDEALNPRLRS
jgi:peptide/nickel transport system permease protein